MGATSDPQNCQNRGAPESAFPSGSMAFACQCLVIENVSNTQETWARLAFRGITGYFEDWVNVELLVVEKELRK